MANEWTLTGPGGSLAVVWPADQEFALQSSVVGMSQRVIGRPKPVFRHFSANVEFTLHHIFSDRTAVIAWDTMFGSAKSAMETLSGVGGVTVDFLATLTGPSSYSSPVQIISINLRIPQPPHVRTYRLAIAVREASL